MQAQDSLRNQSRWDIKMVYTWLRAVGKRKSGWIQWIVGYVGLYVINTYISAVNTDL